MKNNRMKKVLTNILIWILYMSIFVVIYRECVFENKINIIADGKGYFAQKCFWANSIKGGEFALWNPYIGIGSQFAADVQNAVYDPTNLLYLFLNPVLSFNLAYIIKLAFAALFMYILIYEITERRFLAVLSGIIFSFSGMLGGARIEHVSIITTIALFPLIIYFMEKYRKSLELKFLLFSSVAMAFQFIVGFTQIVLYFNIILFGYLVCIGFSQKISWKQWVLNCLIWIVTYLLVASIQLIPLVKLIAESLVGDKVWEAFTVYAYDIRILILMFFPKLFVNSFCPWGDYSTSGIDIEIYIGIISMIYIVYLLRYHLFKVKVVQIYLTLGFGALLYGMLPKIPIINRILYKIPILNSFRVAGRSLLIFIFFAIVLLAIGLAKMKNQDEIKKVIKINVEFIISILIIWLIGWSVSSQEVFKEILDSSYYISLFKEIRIILLLLVGNLFFLCIGYFAKENNKKYMLILSMVTLLIVMDVGRYSLNREKFAGEKILSSAAEDNVFATAKNDTEDNYRSFSMTGILDIGEKIDVFQLNKSTMLKLLVYNSYITFLNSKLLYWDIAETAYYSSTLNMLKERNDLISMLGLHSIIDAGDNTVDISKTIDEKNIKILNELIADENQKLSGNGDVQVLNYKVADLQKNSSYMISLNLESSEKPKLFYIDFYGNNYDYPMQDAGFSDVNIGGKEMVTYISTEEIPDEDIYVRIVWQSSDDIVLNNLRIDKIEQNSVYNEVSTENDIIIYENRNAEKILYVPSVIYNIDDYGTTYHDSEMVNVNENNYILNYNKTVELAGVDTEISDIKVGSNYVAANITSNKDTFINHSQLYTTDWKAYVDGKKVKVYNVNNLIQGIEVPEGKHVIEFRFEPWDIYVGLAITLISLSLIAIYIFKNRKVQKFEVVE